MQRLEKKVLEYRLEQIKCRWPEPYAPLLDAFYQLGEELPRDPLIRDIYQDQLRCIAGFIKENPTSFPKVTIEASPDIDLEHLQDHVNLYFLGLMTHTEMVRSLPEDIQIKTAIDMVDAYLLGSHDTISSYKARKLELASSWGFLDWSNRFSYDM